MPGTFFHVSCITYSSQPCSSLPRRAARLTLSLQCIIKLKYTALLPNGYRKHGVRERGGPGIHITYSSSSFCILLDFKASNNKPCTDRASPQWCYAAVSSFLHPGEQLPSVCALREHFPQRAAGFRARTCVYSQLSVFKRFLLKSESLGIFLASRALTEPFPA